MFEVYRGMFRDLGDVANYFQVNLPVDLDVLFALYGIPDYDGEAFVLYREGGKLYEVNGCHCSCHGLEGQWEPEETSKAALTERQWSTYCFDQNDIDDLRTLVASL